MIFAMSMRGAGLGIDYAEAKNFDPAKQVNRLCQGAGCGVGGA